VSSTPKSSSQLFRAPWVIPVTAPVLKDGAVVVDGKRIVAVGPYSELSRRFPDLPHTPCSGVLLPALVNCHIHLDLSLYGTVHPDPEDRTMCGWIRALLKKRQQSEYSDDELKEAAEKTAKEQYGAGVGLLLDIGNVTLGNLDSCPLEIRSLFEMLGPSRGAQQAAIKTIQTLPPDRSVTGHAPYSTTPELLRYIKKRCNEQGEIFSLHLAENRDEALLLVKNDGCFPQFLKERGAWDDTFPIPGIDSNGVVGYLQTLGIFDEKTICVHCVHLTTRELEIITSTKAHICLCPGSNKFLGVGRAPLEQILDHTILPALGTDSIASNPDLDMWLEMALLREEHPGVAPEMILAMATLGGAKAMQRENDYGSLEEGREASFLHVQGREYEGVEDADQLLDLLTSSGRPESIIWL
jgi:cytosine/adenosine deaminase-related metal-dependent hydrolase